MFCRLLLGPGAGGGIISNKYCRCNSAARCISAKEGAWGFDVEAAEEVEDDDLFLFVKAKRKN